MKEPRATGYALKSLNDSYCQNSQYILWQNSPQSVS